MLPVMGGAGGMKGWGAGDLVVDWPSSGLCSAASWVCWCSVCDGDSPCAAAAAASAAGNPACTTPKYCAISGDSNEVGCFVASVVCDMIAC